MEPDLDVNKINKLLKEFERAIQNLVRENDATIEETLACLQVIHDDLVIIKYERDQTEEARGETKQ